MSLKFPKNLARTHKSQVSSTAKTSCDGEDAGLTYNSVSCNNLKIDTHSNSSLKVRRLKTRKERNQIRCKQRQCKQRHMCHPCQQHISKDVGEKAQMHHMHRKEKPFVPQIQSIITEGRLTSTKGLFSHEIRSAKIDRILRERTKRNGQDEENTEKLMMPITPLVPPIGPVSDQDCSLNVEHEQENPPPHLKSSKDKVCDLKVPKGFPRLNKGQHNFKRRMENNDTKANSDEPEHVFLPSSENESVRLCSASDEVKKNDLGISQTSTFKSLDRNHDQTCEEASTLVDASNMEVLQMENLESFTCLSEVDSEASVLGASEDHASLSFREPVKRLTKRLYQSSDLHVPNHRRPLMVEVKEMLMQVLQKRHGCQLEHNLNRFHSFLNVKQTASQTISEQIFKDSCIFSQPVENQHHRRKVETWKDNSKMQEFFSDQVKHKVDRGASIQKHKMQEWNKSNPIFVRKQPVERPTAVFDQWRAAKQSEDGTRVQGHSIGQFFNQDISTLDGAPVLRVPFGIDPPVDLYSQNLFQSKDSGLQKKDFFNLTRIPQLWKAETGLNMNSFQTFDIRKQKPQETSARESNIWPHSSVVLNEREKHVPFSFSAAYLTEGFKYEPFFRCPHPSNTQSKSECVSMSRYLNLSTPFYSPHFL